MAETEVALPDSQEEQPAAGGDVSSSVEASRRHGPLDLRWPPQGLFAVLPVKRPAFGSRPVFRSPPAATTQADTPGSEPASRSASMTPAKGP